MLAIANLIELMMEPDGAGWRDHAEFLAAWEHGLDWFLNYEGGDILYALMAHYQDYLREEGFEGLPDIDL